MLLKSLRTSVPKLFVTTSSQLNIEPLARLHFPLHFQFTQAWEIHLASLLSNMASMLILLLVYCLKRIEDTKEGQVVTNDTPSEHTARHGCQEHNISSERSWKQTWVRESITTVKTLLAWNISIGEAPRPWEEKRRKFWAKFRGDKQRTSSGKL